MDPERGSVLLLVPAGLLVLLVLAAIAVDGAVVFLAQRELAGAAAAAANDAATAVDEGAFYAGEVVLDGSRAADTAAAALAARRPRGVDVDGPPEVLVSATTVTVVVAGRVRPPFGHRDFRLAARATAVAAARG